MLLVSFGQNVLNGGFYIKKMDARAMFLDLRENSFYDPKSDWDVDAIFFLACTNGDVKIAHLMIQNGCDINKQGFDQQKEQIRIFHREVILLLSHLHCFIERTNA